MDWTIIVAFVVVSASLNGLMTMFKSYSPVADNEFFKKHKPLLPPLLGTVAGLLFTFFYLREPAMLVLSGFAGFLAGCMSTTSYDMFEALVKRKVDKL